MRIIPTNWALGFQIACREWIVNAFSQEVGDDKVERTHRFCEEALELVQACGCTREEVLQLVDYVYDRPVGVQMQEVGGTIITLGTLCNAFGIDMGQAGTVEMARCWAKMDTIRVKQAAKPKFGPLPGPTAKTA